MIFIGFLPPGGRLNHDGNKESPCPFLSVQSLQPFGGAFKFLLSSVDTWVPLHVGPSLVALLLFQVEQFSISCTFFPRFLHLAFIAL